MMPAPQQSSLLPAIHVALLICFDGLCALQKHARIIPSCTGLHSRTHDFASTPPDEHNLAGTSASLLRAELIKNYSLDYRGEPDSTIICTSAVHANATQELRRTVAGIETPRLQAQALQGCPCQLSSRGFSRCVTCRCCRFCAFCGTEVPCQTGLS